MKLFSIHKFFCVLFTFSIFGVSAQLTGTVDYTSGTTCFGGSDGLVQIIASGGTSPYTFSVNPGNPTPQYISPDTVIFNGLPAGTYSYEIEDATATTFTGSFTITEPSPITINTTVSPDTCNQCLGRIYTQSSGGIGTHDYSINGGSPSSTGFDFNFLCEDIYTITVSDANGCSEQQLVNVTNTAGGYGSAVGNITSTPSYCNDGSLFLNITGGNGPFEIDWITGDSSAMINNLGPGSYTVNVADSTGCYNTFTGLVADSSNGQCATVSGKVFGDINQNCTNDGEIGIPNAIVQTQPGNYVAVTNQNGDYTLNVPYGNYSISQGPNQSVIQGCNNSYNVSPSTSNSSIVGIDFADSSSFDLKCFWSPGILRPVFLNTQSLQFSNISSVNGYGTGYYIPDPNYTVSQTMPAFDSQSGDTLFWNNISLNAFDLEVITIYGNTQLPINSNLQFCYGIIPDGGDINNQNNESCDSITVVAGYDPNDKQVSPSGDIELSDEVLTYKIRFQNTGTDTAFNISILDTLSSHLDPASFEFVASSHNCIPSYVDNNVLKFYFPNILLPDSNVNEPLSHGFVTFRIRQSSSNQIGDVIENTAGIYFDFNEPVITNTTISPIVQDVTSIAENNNEYQLKIYPNPSKDWFTVVLPKANEGSITIYDLQGRLMSEYAVNGLNQLTINASSWENGMYILSWTDGKNTINERIVKQ